MTTDWAVPLSASESVFSTFAPSTFSSGCFSVVASWGTSSGAGPDTVVSFSVTAGVVSSWFSVMVFWVVAADSDSEFEAVSAAVVVSLATGAAVISSLTDDEVVDVVVGTDVISSLTDEVVVGAAVISSLTDDEVVVGATSRAAPEAVVVSMMETMVLEEAPEIRFYVLKIVLHM